MENMEEIIELNDGCDCGCGCDDVELLSDKEPEVLLFDEYAEPYENEIIRTREAAEATLELVTEKAAAIEAKEDLLLDDTTTIKRELRKGIIDIRGDISRIITNTLEECSEEEIYEMFNENTIQQ